MTTTLDLETTPDAVFSRSTAVAGPRGSSSAGIAGPRGLERPAVSPAFGRHACDQPEHPAPIADLDDPQTRSAEWHSAVSPVANRPATIEPESTDPLPNPAQSSAQAAAVLESASTVQKLSPPAERDTACSASPSPVRTPISELRAFPVASDQSPAELRYAHAAAELRKLAKTNPMAVIRAYMIENGQPDPGPELHEIPDHLLGLLQRSNSDAACDSPGHSAAAATASSPRASRPSRRRPSTQYRQRDFKRVQNRTVAFFSPALDSEPPSAASSVPQPSTLNSQPGLYSHYGLIARLPQSTRDKISELLDQDTPFSEIITAVAPIAPDLTVGSLRIWQAGGYQDWRNEHPTPERLKEKEDFALSLSLDKERSTLLRQTVLDIAATRLCELLAHMDVKKLLPKVESDADTCTELFRLCVALSDARIRTDRHQWDTATTPQSTPQPAPDSAASTSVEIAGPRGTSSAGIRPAVSLAFALPASEDPVLIADPDESETRSAERHSAVSPVVNRPPSGEPQSTDPLPNPGPAGAPVSEISNIKYPPLALAAAAVSAPSRTVQKLSPPAAPSSRSAGVPACEFWQGPAAASADAPASACPVVYVQTPANTASTFDLRTCSPLLSSNTSLGASNVTDPRISGFAIASVLGPRASDLSSNVPVFQTLKAFRLKAQGWPTGLPWDPHPRPTFNRNAPQRSCGLFIRKSAAACQQP